MNPLLLVIRQQLKKGWAFAYYKIRLMPFYNRHIHQTGVEKFGKDIFYTLIGNNFDQVHTISIETLTACNLRCSYCPNSVYDRGLIKNNQEMEIGLYKKVIDELAELNWVGEVLPHSYGEPLLDERLAELCAYTRKKLPLTKINIYTNGELLNIDWYKRLIQAGVSKFTVTQHLAKQAAGVLDVIEYRKKHGNDNIDFNYNKLFNINTRGGLIDVEDGKQRLECNYPDHHVGISYDGQIMICCNDYLNEVKIGNVKNEALIDIWHKPTYKKIRDDISSGNLTLNICENCSDGKVFE